MPDSVMHYRGPTSASNTTGITEVSSNAPMPVAMTGSRSNVVDSGVITISSSTAETDVLAAIASTFQDVTLVLVNNTSATATRVDFRDAAAGTVRFSVYVPAGDIRGFNCSLTPFLQATANNKWTAQCSGSVADIRITLQAIKRT